MLENAERELQFLLSFPLNQEVFYVATDGMQYQRSRNKAVLAYSFGYVDGAEQGSGICQARLLLA